MTKALIRKTVKAAVYPFGRSACMGSITSVKTKEPMVALTFDDGPNPESTPQLLDILWQQSAKASFFVIGEEAAKHHSIVERMANEDHAVCNHGWSHRSLPLLTGSECIAEIERGAAEIRPFGTRLFRPPYGHQTPRTRYLTKHAHHQVAVWSGHIADWRQQESAELERRLDAQLRPGAIILLHDSIRTGTDIRPSPDLQIDRRPLLRALLSVLQKRSKDFDFVTLPTLLASGQTLYRNWYHFEPTAV